MKTQQRRIYVFLSLVGFMAVTGLLLLSLAPRPLRPDLPAGLLATSGAEDFDAIFTTRIPATSGNWQYIHVRQSLTPAGDAHTMLASPAGLGDHFVIANGNGATDGEIQLSHLWASQAPAAPPPGASQIDPRCISICLIGDLDHSPPTPTQLRRLSRLVSTLQARLRIPADRVVATTLPGTPATAGKLFPVADFRSNILP